MKQEETQEKSTGQQQEKPTSYAVKPHHKQTRLISYTKHDSLFKVRNSLNIAFILLTLVGIILYMSTDSHTVAYIILLVGVVLKIAEVTIRIFHK